jgi:hypothetical protein
MSDWGIVLLGAPSFLIALGVDAAALAGLRGGKQPAGLLSAGLMGYALMRAAQARPKLALPAALVGLAAAARGHSLACLLTPSGNLFPPHVRGGGGELYLSVHGYVCLNAASRRALVCFVARGPVAREPLSLIAMGWAHLARPGCAGGLHSRLLLFASPVPGLR